MRTTIHGLWLSFRRLFRNCLLGACAALGAAGVSPAHAGCIDSCMTIWDCQGEAARGSTNTSMCMNYQLQCLERCNQTPDNTPQGPRGAYGAIAYDSKTGAWGVSDQSTSKKDAKKSALAYCRRYGKDCEIVESFSKRCAVVAESTDGAVGWGADENARAAAEDALKRCNKRSAMHTCHIRVKSCYFD